MLKILKQLYISSFCLIILGAYVTEVALAQSGASTTLEMVCESAGGVWDDSMDTLCAPCALCISNNGEVREDSYVQCLPDCQPWCRCPEGLIFINNSCVAPEDVLGSCNDENPRAITCVESGGDWGNCVDTCTYCLSDAGERVISNGGCPEVCFDGCSCPEGQSATDEGCKPDEEVIPSCEESAGGANMEQDNEQDNEQNIKDSDSCDQPRSRAPLWILSLLLPILFTRKMLQPT